jgi:hypothetical protein
MCQYPAIPSVANPSAIFLLVSNLRILKLELTEKEGLKKPRLIDMCIFRVPHVAIMTKAPRKISAENNEDAQ